MFTFRRLGINDLHLIYDMQQQICESIHPSSVSYEVSISKP